MVEVFKTDVYEEDRSITIVQKLLNFFPKNKINFDLDDCDKVLRIEGENILPGRIMELLKEEGHECEILD